MINVTITITDGEYTEVVTLNTEETTNIVNTADTINNTYSDTIHRIVNRGCYDIKYRFTHNQKNYKEFKEWKSTQKGNK